MQNNIRGEFTISLNGKERKMRATFGVVEQLEYNLLKGTVFEALAGLSVGRISVKEMAYVFHAGLAAAGDTRMTAQEVGQAIVEAGADNHAELYSAFLTYLLTGGRPPKGGASGEDQAGQADTP